MRDVGVLRRELDDGVVGDLRASGELLVDREHDAADLPRAVVVGERVPVASALRLRSTSARRLVGCAMRSPVCSRWTWTSIADEAIDIESLPRS